MKRISATILLSLFAISCCSVHKSPNLNSAAYQPASYGWASPEDIQERLQNPSKKPVYILFVFEECSKCMGLAAEITQRGWSPQVFIINAKERWVQDLIYIFGVKKLPTLMVATPDGKKIMKKITNSESILSYLSMHLN